MDCDEEHLCCANEAHGYTCGLSGNWFVMNDNDQAKHDGEPHQPVEDLGAM